MCDPDQPLDPTLSSPGIDELMPQAEQSHTLLPPQQTTATAEPGSSAAASPEPSEQLPQPSEATPTEAPRRRIRKLVRVSDLPLARGTGSTTAGTVSEPSEQPGSSGKPSTGAPLPAKGGKVSSVSDPYGVEGTDGSGAAQIAVAQHSSLSHDANTRSGGNATLIAEAREASDDGGEEGGERKPARSRLAGKRQEQQLKLEALASQARKREYWSSSEDGSGDDVSAGIDAEQGGMSGQGHASRARGAELAALRRLDALASKARTEKQRQQQPSVAVSDADLPGQQRVSSLRQRGVAAHLEGQAVPRSKQPGIIPLSQHVSAARKTPNTGSIAQGQNTSKRRNKGGLAAKTGRGATRPGAGMVGEGASLVHDQTSCQDADQGTGQGTGHSIGLLKRPSALRAVKSRGIGSIER